MPGRPLWQTKYRRKIVKIICLLVVLSVINSLVISASSTECSSGDCSSKNSGSEIILKKNLEIECNSNRSLSKCQFCSGKVRLTETYGWIHDGFGNYSIGVKCSWLIDPRNSHNTTNSNVTTAIGKKKIIRLHLEEFATECGWDYLYVFDGDSVQSPLLAVFSGLMYKNSFSIRRIPEIVAHSGSALLHFFSDDAYSMSGFNISYRVDSCPTTNSALICSGHGVCIDDGKCTCNADYMGDACHISKCPNNCSAQANQGHCDREHHKCICERGFAGSDCTQIASLGYWETITPPFQPPGTASHSATVWDDTMFIIGGESYGHGHLMKTYDFTGNVWETVHSKEGNNTPEMRYGSSSVIYGDKIYVYGGVIEGKGVTSELWAFDIYSKKWENITVKAEYSNSSFAMSPPLESVGHTSTLVPGDDGSKSKYMVVIFGYSPIFGFLNTVQEFNFGTREWKIVNTQGYPVKGGYGHTASYDSLTEKIYVYGGIVSESETAQILTSRLYAYDSKTKHWKMLAHAPSARYLHTANFVSPGFMMAFGGNTHNDTSHSFGAKCYSNELLIYDVICDSWFPHTMPSDLQADLARFGHSAVIFEKSLYIYGGFDGQMLSDMIKFTPGNCSALQKAESCLYNRPGLKCIWDIQKSLCISVAEVQEPLLLGRDQELFLTCREKGRHESTLQQLTDYEQCQAQSSCQACVSLSVNCSYCGINSEREVCSLKKCPEAKNYKQRSTPVKTLDKCSPEPKPVCEQLHKCQSCMAQPFCHWSYFEQKCLYFDNRNNKFDIRSPCPPACSSLTTCANCTQDECIWCQNEERCVDKNAYTASFPYGQCREWTTYANKCRPSTDSSQCSFYKTCAQCRDDPACGWCDDGSVTGLGKCMAGGGSGSTEDTCPTNNWHFTNCPSCQCNGHSTCTDNMKCKQPCDHLTVGENCDKCKPGYWGNPVNGGTCQKCECNGQATFCNSETGKCYCSTKGLIGDHCQKCDATNHYHGDPSKGSCYYDLTIDYQFTFNLSKKEDRHYTQINFRNSPVKVDIDADFNITCSVPAKMNITVRTINQNEKVLFSNIDCSTFVHRFSKDEFTFSEENNLTLTTFYVYVYDLKPPLWIQIAFSQYPKLNLQQFFITFATIAFSFLPLIMIVFCCCCGSCCGCCCLVYFIYRAKNTNGR